MYPQHLLGIDTREPVPGQDEAPTFRYWRWIDQPISQDFFGHEHYRFPNVEEIQHIIDVISSNYSNRVGVPERAGNLEFPDAGLVKEYRPERFTNMSREIIEVAPLDMLAKSAFRWLNPLLNHFRAWMRWYSKLWSTRLATIPMALTSRV